MTLRRLKQILGMDVSLEQVEEVFQALEFETERTGDSSLEVAAPYWRSDINIEEDLIEEVVRIIGYDNVPTTMLSAPIPYRQPAPMTELRGAGEGSAGRGGVAGNHQLPAGQPGGLGKGQLRCCGGGPVAGGQPDERRQRAFAPHPAGQSFKYVILQRRAQ